jgi:single-strand DNA-binding protein
LVNQKFSTLIKALLAFTFLVVFNFLSTLLLEISFLFDKLANKLHHKVLTMRGLNKVTLIGNLGKDPETTVLEGNISVSKFSLATTETYKDKSGQAQSSTDWHTIVAWRGLADLASKYLKKGSLVYIEGKIKNRTFDDKEGVKRSVTEILAEEIIILDKKEE